ncbi:MAG: hypothetical protein HYU69_04580 [Bacteroidetes bacterium]|nr:hypothetical protein [Bacteroidota bacterium]
MKRNKVAIVLVVLLGSISFWFIVNNKKSTLRKGLRDFALEDTAGVTKLFLADKNNRAITLEKQRPGLWRLNDKFYARNDAVNMLLETMKQIEVKSPVSKNAQENVIKSLAAGGIKIEAYKGDKLIKIYYVGSETQDMLGTYMLLADPETMENSTVPYITYIPGFDGYLTTRYFTNETDWRDRSVFRYTPPEIKSVRVEFPSKPDDGFEINNLPGVKFEVRSLLDNIPLTAIDTMTVKQYISYFQNIQYELIEKLEKSLIDSVSVSTPINIITVTDVKGNKNVVKLFYKSAAPGAVDHITGKPAVYDKDRIFALINNGADFVTVQYFVFGKLLQPITYFSPKDNVKK